MVKKIRYKGIRDPRKRATIKETADITGVSESLVEKVLNADRENEGVLSVFMTLKEKHDQVVEEMMQEVNNWTTIFNRSKKQTTLKS